MRPFTLLFVFLFTLLQAQESHEKIVAMVNSIAITQEELKKEVGKLLPQAYYHATLDDEKYKKLEQQALDILIEKTLLYDHALSLHMTIASHELEKIVEALTTAYGSKKDFLIALSRMGYTLETFSKAVEKDEILKLLYKKKIEASYSDDDLTHYYETNKFKFKEPEKIKVRLIYIKNDPALSDGKAQAKAKANEAMKELQKGIMFEDVASKYSNAMSRIKGGDLGYIHKGRLLESVDNIAFSLNVGEVSPIIEEDIGFFIVEVEDKRDPQQLSFSAVKGSLLQELKKNLEEKRKSELLKRLRMTAKIIKY